MEDKYLTVTECAKKYQILDRKIRSLHRNGYIQTKKNGNYILVNENSIKQYIEDHKIKTGAFGNIRIKNGEALYLINGYDYQYATDKNGQIYCLSTGNVLKPNFSKSDPYPSVFVKKNGEYISKRVHKLIAENVLDNSLGKDKVHHINGNKQDNRLVNLIPVRQYEHDKSHELMEHGTKEEYRNYIKSIKQENKMKVYEIPHPDFPDGETLTYRWLVDGKGYKAYKEGEEIPLDSIKLERIDFKKK